MCCVVVQVSLQCPVQSEGGLAARCVLRRCSEAVVEDIARCEVEEHDPQRGAQVGSDPQ